MGSSADSRAGTGWVYHDAFLQHNATLPHPECPQRLAAIVERLTTARAHLSGFAAVTLVFALPRISLNPLTCKPIE